MTHPCPPDQSSHPPDPSGPPSASTDPSGRGTSPPPTARKGRWRVVLAWGGTATILAYLGATTDLRRAWDAFVHADQTLFLITMFLSVPLVWVADAASVRVVLHRTGFSISLRDFLRIKGASYLLNILNYNLALAMMAALVSKRSDRGIAASGSPFILLNFLDLGALGLLILGGLASGARPFADPAVLWTLGAFAAAGVLGGPVLSGLARIRAGKAAGDPGDGQRFLRVARRILRHDVLSAFRSVGPGEYAGLCLLRMAFVSLYVVSNYFLLRAFGIGVPLGDLFAYQPILAFIIFIPISVAGLGSTQVVMRHFYGPHAPAGAWAVVDAYSTATIVMFVLMRSVIGLLCMPWVTKALKEDGPTGGHAP